MAAKVSARLSSLADATRDEQYELGDVPLAQYSSRKEENGNASKQKPAETKHSQNDKSKSNAKDYDRTCSM